MVSERGYHFSTTLLLPMRRQSLCRKKMGAGILHFTVDRDLVCTNLGCDRIEVSIRL